MGLSKFLRYQVGNPVYIKLLSSVRPKTERLNAHRNANVKVPSMVAMLRDARRQWHLREWPGALVAKYLTVDAHLASTRRVVAGCASRPDVCRRVNSRGHLRRQQSANGHQTKAAQSNRSPGRFADSIVTPIVLPATSISPQMRRMPRVYYALVTICCRRSSAAHLHDAVRSPGDWHLCERLRNAI